MAEIEKRMDARYKKLDREYDLKKDELSRTRKELQRAAKSNDEMTVREIARECIAKEKLYKSAEARRNKVTQNIEKMSKMSVDGELSTDMIEFMQCHNKLTAKAANPNVVKQTVGQFTMQSEAFKLCEELLADAMESASEDEEELNKDSQAVEALVRDTMSNSSYALLEKLPTIRGAPLSSNNNNTNKNPATTAKNIEQFLEHKK